MRWKSKCPKDKQTHDIKNLTTDDSDLYKALSKRSLGHTVRSNNAKREASGFKQVVKVVGMVSDDERTFLKQTKFLSLSESIFEGKQKAHNS